MIDFLIQMKPQCEVTTNYVCTKVIRPFIPVPST